MQNFFLKTKTETRCNHITN